MDAERVEHHLEHAPGVAKPRRSRRRQAERAEDEVDQAVVRVEPEEDDGDDDRGADRGEVERRAKERPAPDLAVRQHRQDQPGSGLGGHDAGRIPDGVAQRGMEIVVADEVAVVVEGDEWLLRRDHVPAVEAEPEGIEDGTKDEPDEDDERRQHEDPTGQIVFGRDRIAAAGRDERGHPSLPSQRGCGGAAGKAFPAPDAVT